MYKEPTIDRKISALQLPRIILTEKWNHELKAVLESLQGAQVHFSCFQDANGDLKVLHSGINEEMYAVIQCALNRHIEFYDLMKLSIINADQFRKGDFHEAYETMTRGVEYIRIKQGKNLYL